MYVLSQYSHLYLHRVVIFYLQQVLSVHSKTDFIHNPLKVHKVDALLATFVSPITTGRAFLLLPTYLIKVEKILKDSLYSIPSPSTLVKIQFMGGKVVKAKQKFCWHHPTIFCLITSSKISCQQFEFSQKVKVIGSNPSYLLKNLFYFTFFHFHQDHALEINNSFFETMGNKEMSRKNTGLQK